VIKKILHIASSLCLSLLFITCDTESSVDPNFENYFVKYYGQDGNQIGVDIVSLEDGFVLLGTSVTTTQSNIILVRTDEIGNQQWQLEMGGTSAEANALDIDASGNLIVAGTNLISGSYKDMLIFRVSSEGALLDSLSFGELNEIEEANDITITTGGDIIVVGSTTNVDVLKPGYNASTDLEDIYSIRLDPGFSPLDLADWRRVTGFPGIERGTTILEKPDGTFLFFGTTDRPPSSPQKDGFNMFLYPAGDDGQAISSTQLQLFGTLADESASQMVQTIDGGYAMVGTSSSSTNDIYIVRVRSNNEFLSSGLLNSGRNVVGRSLMVSSSGGLLLLGTETVNNNGNIYLARTSVNGSILWEESFGGDDNEVAGKVTELEDGSIAIIGTADLESQTKMCLIKTNSLGELKR